MHESCKIRVHFANAGDAQIGRWIQRVYVDLGDEMNVCVIGQRAKGRRRVGGRGPR